MNKKSSKTAARNLRDDREGLKVSAWTESTRWTQLEIYHGLERLKGKPLSTKEIDYTSKQREQLPEDDDDEAIETYSF